MSRKKKKEPAEQEVQSPGPEDGDEAPGALHEPFWSVVSFDGCVASNLTYDEAADLASSLEKENTPGICVVTNAAAQRITQGSGAAK